MKPVAFSFFICFLSLINGNAALIIPDEVPTLLSLIYSNIPTLKKGTDSRLGWGFRLGNRADFQVLVELGPQTNTQPLANQGDNANKRAAAQNLANVLYAQSLLNKQEQKEPGHGVISNTKGGEFIKQWSEDLQAHLRKPNSADNLPVALAVPVISEVETPTKFTLGIGEVDAKDYIPPPGDGDEHKPPISGTAQRSYNQTPQGALDLLSQMYSNTNMNKENDVHPTVKPPKTTTSWKDALDNVDLD